MTKKTEHEKFLERQELEQELGRVFRLKKGQAEELQRRVAKAIKEEAQRLLHKIQEDRKAKEAKKETKPDPHKCQHEDLEFSNGGHVLTCTTCKMRYIAETFPYYNVRILSHTRRSGK